MQVVPLVAQPAQNFQIVLNGQNCQISLYTRTGYAYSDTPGFTVPGTNLYFDLTANGEIITTCAVCLNQKRLLINRQYLGFLGDFMFIDTQGALDPQYQGLAARFVLLYLSPADLDAS